MHLSSAWFMPFPFHRLSLYCSADTRRCVFPLNNWISILWFCEVGRNIRKLWTIGTYLQWHTHTHTHTHKTCARMLKWTLIRQCIALVRLFL
jgi:hypothetical protein